MVNKNLITGKKHEDRELAAKTCFETTPIDIESPQTMILLLQSKEEMVLLKALSSLDKYAGKLEQNAKNLHEEGVLKPLIPLLEHPNLYIKRFSTKLLAELCFLQSVVDNLLEENEELLLNIMKLLHEVNDPFVKEFSASIVAELTKTKIGYDRLVESNMINILIPLLSTTDPDIQYNCSKIILNLLSFPNDKTVVTEDSSFTVKHFINLLMSEYVAVQNITLDILYLLTEQTKGNPVPKLFQDAGGVTKLLAIIKNYEWKDIHGKALDVLGNIYNDPTMAQNFLKDGVMQIFSYIDFVTDPQLLRRAVEVLAKIAETPLGRKVFADSGYTTKLETMLGDHNDGVCAAVCLTIANLSRDPAALHQLTALPTVDDLLKLVVDEDRPWMTKSAATNALYEILKRDSEACTFVADRFEMGFIEKIMNQFDENAPLQAAVTAANVVTTLAGYGDLKEKIVSKGLISSLLHCFEEFPEDTQVLKLAACEALCSLLSHPGTRDLLHSLDGLSVVWPSVVRTPSNVQFLQSAATFVHLCVTNDRRFTAALLQLGVLDWLLSETQRSLREDCPAWEMALETVFNHFLPIKFAFTGRLEMTDITEDFFYITRVPLSRQQLDNNRFPILDTLISDKCCPLWLIYMVNFGGNDTNRTSTAIESNRTSTAIESNRTSTAIESNRKSTAIESNRKSTAMESARESMKTSLPKKSLAESIVSKKDSKRDSIRDSTRSSLKSFSIGYSQFSGSFNRDKILSPDPYLLKYTESLKEALDENGYSAEPSKRNQAVLDEDTIRGKTRVVGQFVAKQMSGIEQNEVCTAHMMDLHLNEIMVELSDDIIPLGFLRVGLHLERALLFKVLADRVGLACSLVRGGGPRRRGWVEVSVPHLPPAPRPAYPDSLLRPSHVVDLMDDPGALLPLGSYEADLYCGRV